MFRAAFTSALEVYPQAVQAKAAWLSRDFASTCPHAEQRWLVNAGLIFSIRPNALFSSPADQQAPRAGEDRPVEPGFLPDVLAGCADCPLGRAGHIPNSQIFDADHVKPPGKVGGSLLSPVTAPVTLAGSQLRDGQSDVSAAIGTVLRPGHAPLQPQQPLPFALTQFGCAEEFAGQQRCGDGHAAVDNYDVPCSRRVDRWWDSGEGDMPSPGRITSHPAGLHVLWYRAGPAERDQAHLRYPHLPCVPRRPANVTGFEVDNAESLITPGLPPRRPLVGPGEVVRHSLGVILKRLLLDDHRSSRQPRIVRAGFGELSAAPGKRWHSAATGPVVRFLFHAQVPHEPGVGAMFQQGLLLGRSWPKPIPGHGNTLEVRYDISRPERGRVPQTIRAAEMVTDA